MHVAWTLGQQIRARCSGCLGLQLENVIGRCSGCARRTRQGLIDKDLGGCAKGFGFRIHWLLNGHLGIRNLCDNCARQKSARHNVFQEGSIDLTVKVVCVNQSHQRQVEACVRISQGIRCCSQEVAACCSARDGFDGKTVKGLLHGLCGCTGRTKTQGGSGVEEFESGGCLNLCDSCASKEILKDLLRHILNRAHK